MREAKRDEKVLNQGLEAIDRNARVQAQLIDDLLDVSRIVSGKLNLDVRPLDIIFGSASGNQRRSTGG